MCEHGDTVRLRVLTVDIETGAPRWRYKQVDRCLAPMVKALNAAGIHTKQCCCGHGDEPGIIGLADGRALVVVDARGRPLGNIAHDFRETDSHE